MEDREDHAVAAEDPEDHATVAVVYDGGGQLVVERTDLVEEVDGGRHVAEDQKDHEADGGRQVAGD